MLLREDAVDVDLDFRGRGHQGVSGAQGGGDLHVEVERRVLADDDRNLELVRQRVSDEVADPVARGFRNHRHAGQELAAVEVGVEIDVGAGELPERVSQERVERPDDVGLVRVGRVDLIEAERDPQGGQGLARGNRGGADDVRIERGHLSRRGTEQGVFRVGRVDGQGGEQRVGTRNERALGIGTLLLVVQDLPGGAGQDALRHD